MPFRRPVAAHADAWVPVFVDDSGLRLRWTRRGLQIVAVLAALVVAAVVLSVLTGVPLPGLTSPVRLPPGEAIVGGPAPGGLPPMVPGASRSRSAAAALPPPRARQIPAAPGAGVAGTQTGRQPNAGRRQTSAGASRSATRPAPASPSTGGQLTPSTGRHTTPSTAQHTAPSTAQHTTPSTGRHTTPVPSPHPTGHRHTTPAPYSTAAHSPSRTPHGRP